MQDSIDALFLGKEKIAKDTWRFSFEKGNNFSYTPGQYASIFLDNDFRDFTIASSPLENDAIFIVTKVGKSAFKKKLFSLSAGSKIAIQKPSGGFVLHEDAPMPLIFLAGGIGITPFYSMIAYAHKAGLNIPITLIASFSKKENMIFYKELQKIDQENRLIKVIYTLSQDSWEDENGRISKTLIKKHIYNLQHVSFMIAGGEKMVENMESLLLEMGVDASNIRLDIFTGY